MCVCRSADFAPQAMESPRIKRKCAAKSLVVRGLTLGSRDMMFNMVLET